jgi:hypothetical protein
MKKKIEIWLLNKYKWYVGLYKKYRRVEDWNIILLLQEILNKFYCYDFPYINNHYLAIKNEKVIYEYDLK